MEKNYARIIEEISKCTDINLQDYKEETLIRRIQKRLTLNEVGIDDYAVFLQENPDELKQLSRDVFIHYTEFYRDSDAFKTLTKLVLKPLMENREDLRFWVAGCATGEEVYTLAILWEELLESYDLKKEYTIFATDIENEVVKKAMNGEYNTEEIANLPVKLRDKYFLKKAQGTFRINQHIRDKILFSRHNLLEEPPYINIDLIVCRNLFIYLKSDTQKKAFKKFHFALKKQGYLFLGQSEHIPAEEPDFKTLDRKWRIFQCVDKKQLLGSFHIPLSRDKINRRISDTGKRNMDHTPHKDQQYLKLIADIYAPPCVLIAPNDDIVYMNGDLNSYMQIPEGAFTSQYPEVFRPPLGDLVRDGIIKLKDSEKDNFNSLRYENVQFNGKPIDINLKILPGRDQDSEFILVEFTPSAEDGAPLIIRELDQKDMAQRRITLLEEELRNTHDKLHNTIEELQSTNEELLSSNEELQSTNEEFQTVNKELQESEERYREIVQDQSEFILKLDKELNITFANKSYCRFIGIPCEQLTGTDIRSHMPSNYRPALLKNLEQLNPQNPTVSFEIEEKGFDAGSRTRLEHWTFRGLFGKTGKITGYQCVGIDLTDRLEMEKALKESEKKYRMLFNSMQNGFALHEIILDTKGNPIDYTFLEVNPAFEELTGLREKDLIGKRLKEVMPQTEDYWIQIYGQVAMTGQPVNFDNFAREIGKYYHVYAFSPQKKQFAVIFADVTTRIMAEEELKQARNRAEESDRLKTQFLANMSHEIRTPMNAILGFSELMDDTSLNREEQLRYNQLVRSNAEQLLELINDIIDMSKIEANQIQISESLCSVKSLLADLHSSLEITIPQDLRFRYHYDYDKNLDLVMADSVRIKQILANLINNARKHTRKGHIEFGCVIQPPEYLEFYVEDSGAGISEDDQKRIFDRFYQVDQMSPGAGLGLNICQGLVNFMGGEFWVESQKDKGTTFFFTIPYKSARGVNEEPGKIPESQEQVSQPRILVAEDNTVNYTLIESILKDLDAELFWAKDGEAALKIFREEDSMDIILMDIKMPRVDGITATKRIREQDTQTPIIAVTAYASEEDRIHCLAAGCNDHLAKPYRKKELLAIVRKYLQNDAGGRT